MRKAISPAEKLARILRFLATGESQQSLSFAFRIGRSTVTKIISKTCEAIYDSLRETYLKVPQSQSDWINISTQFEDKWNFPNVVGSIDGKHIRIECPKNTGTLYHNYKGFFSLVLLAVCDANYVFTMFDVGGYGSNNDCGILINSRMGKLLENEELNLPSSKELKDCKFNLLPYFLLGDEIFPLKSWLIRPYPGRDLPEAELIYNYHYSRARRTIENAFGILSARWRIFLTPIRATV